MSRICGFSFMAVFMVVLAGASSADAQQEPDGCIGIQWTGDVEDGVLNYQWHPFRVTNGCNANVQFLWRDNHNGQSIDRVINRGEEFNKGVFVNAGESSERRVRVPAGIAPEIRWCAHWWPSSERRRRGAGTCPD